MSPKLKKNATYFYTFFVLYFLFIQNITAQFYPCATDLLKGNKNTVQGLNRKSSKLNKNTTYRIPLAIHLVKSNQQPRPTVFEHFSPDLDLIYDNLADVNKYFRPHNIEFFICGEILRMTSYELSSINYYSLVEIEKLGKNNVENAINVYYVEEIRSNRGTTCGYASYPWSEIENKYVAMNSLCLPTQETGAILAHELGHILGLRHTHDTELGTELADGSNCSDAGDTFCDTPADPNLSKKVSEYCRYTKTEYDSIGGLYTPNINLIMSYSNYKCMSLFTEEQATEMKGNCDIYYQKYICNDIVKDYQSIIYPNPASSWLNLVYLDWGNWDSFKVEFFDINGQLVTVPSILNRRFRVSHLNSGIYFIRIQTIYGKVNKTMKFMVAH